MVGVILAAALAASWGILALRIGPRLGFVDHPDDPSLKAHEVPAVPLGGVGVFLAVHLGLAASDRFDPWLAVGSAMLLVLGLVDDRFGLSPTVRLVVELGAGLFIGVGPAAVGGLGIGLATAALTVLAVNAVNLFDGLDGLAAGVGLVAALGMAGLAAVGGESSEFGLLLAAALAGFLAWNLHPARMFLGDNGAYVLGGFLAYGIGSVGSNPGRFLVGSALMGVYFLDLAFTILRRRLLGAELFAGDRSHLYDRLRRQGLPVPAVAGLAMTVQAGWVLLVVGTTKILSPLVGALILAAVGAVSMAVLLGTKLVGGVER